MLSFSILLFLMFKSDEPKCGDLKIGKFKLVNEKTGVSLITRTANQQIEIVKAINLKAVYSIKWINNCSYQLFNAKVHEGNKIFEGKKTDTISVNIISVTRKSYRVITTSNFSDLKVEDEIQILK